MSGADQFHDLYAVLIQRVHHSSGGFDALSEPEKLYYTVTLLRNEINNGGFHQYFFNSAGSFYISTEAGLRLLRASQALTLLREAREIIFPAMLVPTDTKARRAHILAQEDSDPALVAKLDALDERFYRGPDEITPRLEALAREQGRVE